MTVDLSKLLKLWQGPKQQLPVRGTKEQLFFVTDTPVVEVYIGSDNGSLRRIGNLIFTDYNNLGDITNPSKQVIYVVNNNSSYILGIYTDSGWISIDLSKIVDTDNEVTLTNKTIDATSNIISNLSTSNFNEQTIIKSGDAVTGSDVVGTASSDKLVSEKAFVEYIQKQFNDRINGMEFMGIKTIVELQALQSGEIGNYYILSDAGTLAGINLNKDDKILITNSFKDRNIASTDFYVIASADITKVLTPEGVQKVYNKTIDANNNSIFNISYSEMDPAFIVDGVLTSTSSSTIPTTKAVLDTINNYLLVWEDGNTNK